MRTIRLGLAVALACAIALLGGPSASAAPLPPGQDPFYTYSDATPLTHIAPGTVLKSRTVALGLGTDPTPVNATQLLYRTTDQVGDPSVTVTTVITPATAPVLPRIVGYLSFYDGLGARCDPSYTLAGGDAGGMDEQQAEEEELQILHYLAQGFIVTVPDFEGTGLHWMAGRESGYGTLDAVRATAAYLHLDATTPVGLTGYSGGSVAGDWAAELAPDYAPQVNLVGLAIGGIPVDYWHLFGYVDGTDEFSSAIPGILLGLARAYHLDLSAYLSPYGQQVVRDEQQMCIASTFGHYPGLTVAKIMRAPYQDLRTVPAFVRILDGQIMGSAPGHPRVPILMGIGNSDGTGDGVMRADDVAALAHAYCAAGVPVQLQTYTGASHVTAGAFFDPQTGPFFQQRFAGVPFANGCASIGAGSSIDPVAMPVTAPARRAHHPVATGPRRVTRPGGA
ncbi:MAG TPA: lipase family protein, partial [Mycobacteriales bacterium]|nr:lipase family protein [Mycobacteriales bacterium]